MLAFPPCKINLGLHVVAKRSDGYHDLETCFYPVPWTDILEIIPSDSLSFQATGIDIPGNSNDNIVLKAYELLRKDFKITPVKIHLHKIIPHGAGLGGGSSDSAYAVKLLNEIFNLKLTSDQLKEYALRLGSDCPFFIDSKPVIATGRGELFEDIDLKLTGYNLVIVKPPVSVSTAEAYADIKPKIPQQSLRKSLASPLIEWKNHIVNDFEESVFKKHPLINQLKVDLYKSGAIYASMSGSGSALFALFDKSMSFSSSYSDCIVWQKTL